MESALYVFLAMMGVFTHPQRESVNLNWVRGREIRTCERLDADVKRGALSSWKDFSSKVVPRITNRVDKGNHQDVKTEDDVGSDAATELIDADDDDDDDDDDER
jgi:hypothetical protein